MLISTAGSPHLLTDEHIRPHHRVVIDSGFVPQPDGTIASDVHPRATAIAQRITPVPGGVGPVEMAVLMERIVRRDVDPALPAWKAPQRPLLTRRQAAAQLRSPAAAAARPTDGPARRQPSAAPVLPARRLGGDPPKRSR